MNVFEFFFRITHKRSSLIWEETTATFTGRVRSGEIKTRAGFIKTDYNAYEIAYWADEKKIYSYYTFHPLPDPDPASLLGTTMKIRYKKRRPHVFEMITSSEIKEYDNA